MSFGTCFIYIDINECVLSCWQDDVMATVCVCVCVCARACVCVLIERTRR